MEKIINSFMVFVFAVTCLGVNSQVQAVERLPLPNQLLSLSAEQKVPLLRGLKINPQDPFDFKFIIDSPQASKIDKREIERLFDYFLTALSLEEEKFWVNLSPDEQNRIIDDSLAVTKMGKDMLEQDYLLKQLSSSLTDPETELGAEYWKAGKAHEANKIWIESETAELFEHKDTVIINSMPLRVTAESPRYKSLLSKIEQDVNNGSNFARLRQLNSAFLLATWFKDKFVDSFYKSYINQNKLGNLEKFDAGHKYDVFSAYLKSYRNGVYKKDIKFASERGVRQKRRYSVGGVRLKTKYESVDTFNKFSSAVALVDTKLSTQEIMSSSLSMADLSSEIKEVLKRFDILSVELLKAPGSSEESISYLYYEVAEELEDLNMDLMDLADQNGITAEVIDLYRIYDDLDERLPTAKEAKKQGFSDAYINIYHAFDMLGQSLYHFTKIQELPDNVDDLLSLFDLYHKKLKSVESYGREELDNSQKDMLTLVIALQEFGRNLEHISYIYEKILMLGYGRTDAEKTKLDNMLMFAFVSHICSYAINSADEESTGRRFEAIEELSKIFYRGTKRVRQFLFEALIKDEGMYDKLIKTQLKARKKLHQSINSNDDVDKETELRQLEMINKKIQSAAEIERLFFTTLEYTYLTVHVDELDKLVKFIFTQLKKAAREEFDFIDNDSLANSKIVIALIKSLNANFKRNKHLVLERFNLEKEELQSLLPEELFKSLEKRLTTDESPSKDKQSSSVEEGPAPLILPIVVDPYNSIEMGDDSLFKFWNQLFNAVSDDSMLRISVMHNGKVYEKADGLNNVFFQMFLPKGESLDFIIEAETIEVRKAARELLNYVVGQRLYNLEDRRAFKLAMDLYEKKAKIKLQMLDSQNDELSGGIELKAEYLLSKEFTIPSSFSKLPSVAIDQLFINVEEQQVLLPEESYLLFN